MFTKQDLRDLAGDKSYTRGAGYFEQKRITALELSGGEIQAVAFGTRPYAVTLTLEPELNGYCTCPVSADGGFCKHCVAVGLAYLALDKRDENSANSLRSWLSEWSKQALLDALYETIKSSPELYQDWMLRFKAAQCGDSPEAVAQLVVQALPDEELWEEHECDAYYARADTAICAAVDKIRRLSPEPALELALDALQRLNRALENVRDDWGGSFSLQGSLKILVCEQFARVGAAGWSVERQAQWLVKQLLLDDMIMPVIPGEFLAEVSGLGEAPGLAEKHERRQAVAEAFYVECDRRLAELPRLPFNSDYAAQRKHRLLAAPLLQRAERDDDLVTQIRVWRILASGFKDLLHLSSLESARGDALEAEYYLGKARQLAVHAHEKEACHAQQIQVALVSGEQERALKLQWQQLERWISLENYQRLLQLVSLLAEQGHPVPDKAEITQRAEQLFLDAAEQYLGKSTPFAGRRFDPLVDFYLHNFDYRKAQDWVAKHGATTGQREELAQALLADAPRLAIGHYQHLVLHTLERADNRAYQRAVGYLPELRNGLHELPQSTAATAAPQYRALVAEVRTQHKRKRNLLKLMADKGLY